VSRDYLRVLLHRAKQQFMAEYTHVGAAPRKITAKRQQNKALQRHTDHAL